MTTRDDLEDELATGPHSLETLAVYGDALLAAGDLRGELIATDLALDRDRANATLLQRRRALLERWLGAELAGSPWGQIRYGFIQELAQEALLATLASPGGMFVRAIDVRCHAIHTRELVGTIAAQPRRWLRSLAIASTAQKGQRALVDPETAQALIAATPNLETLVVDGRRVLPDFPHPTVTRLVIRGWSAMAAGVERGGELPNVERVELQLASPVLGSTAGHDVPDAQVANAKLLPAENFPRVRELDVSHNVRHRGDPTGRASILRVLGKVGVLPQLDVLRLPPIETEDHERDVAAALASAPRLTRIEIMERCRTGAPERLAHQHAAIVVRPRPWPSRDRTRPDAAIYFELGAEIAVAAISVIAEWLSPRFETLDDDARAVWTRVFEAVEADEPASLPRVPLARTLEPLAQGLPDRDRGWIAVRDLVSTSRIETVTVAPARMQYAT